MEKKVKIIQIGIEMTRRCNMKCLFCARGDAQNLNISKKIIDKTLDELKSFDVAIVRPHGGEPFLVPELLCYLVDKIIEKKLNLKKCVIFSNGTILNPDIKKALNKLGKYCNENSDEELNEYLKYGIHMTYKNTDMSLCHIIVSQHEHENINVEKFKDYYTDKYLNVCLQEDTFKDSEEITIEISGNAKDNIPLLLDKGYTNFSVLDNRFCVIEDELYEKFKIKTIAKGITISVNGNVYVGCNQSYDEVDKANICNIMDCNNDLYKKIDNWCWTYPLNGKQQKKRNSLRSLMFCFEHDIENIKWVNGEPFNEDHYEVVKFFLDLYERLENYMKIYHKKYPELTHYEIQKMVTDALVKGIPQKYKYLSNLFEI